MCLWGLYLGNFEINARVNALTEPDDPPELTVDKFIPPDPRICMDFSVTEGIFTATSIYELPLVEG